MDVNDAALDGRRDVTGSLSGGPPGADPVAKAQAGQGGQEQRDRRRLGDRLAATGVATRYACAVVRPPLDVEGTSDRLRSGMVSVLCRARS